jgi:hypothetical protein
VRLTEQDKKLFKQIELIEMAEWGMDQICLGNSHGFIVANRCLKAVYENQPHPRLAVYVGKRIVSFILQRMIEFSNLDSDEEWWDPENWGGKNVC